MQLCFQLNYFMKKSNHLSQTINLIEPMIKSSGRTITKSSSFVLATINPMDLSLQCWTAIWVLAMSFI